MTLAAVAGNKKIRLEKLDVQIQYDIKPQKPWYTAFRIAIDPGPGLSRREKSILLNSARWCEVSKLLAGEFSFSYRLTTDS